MLDMGKGFAAREDKNYNTGYNKTRKAIIGDLSRLKIIIQFLYTVNIEEP